MNVVGHGYCLIIEKIRGSQHFLRRPPIFTFSYYGKTSFTVFDIQSIKKTMPQFTAYPLTDTISPYARALPQKKPPHDDS